jgi:hypothetical protein
MTSASNKNISAKSSLRKRAERFPTKLPLSIGNTQGTIHNISATGAYFEIDAKHSPGSQVHFVIDLETPGGKIQVQCQGEIVRVQERDGKLGVAVKINSSDLLGAG